MRDQTREIVGFLCRWALLGVTGGAGVAVGALVLGSAGDVAAGPTARMTVPDAVCRYPGRGHVLGQLTPPYARSPDAAALVSTPDRGLRRVPTGERHLLQRVIAPPIGASRFHFVGIPYSRYAFARADALLWAVPPGRDVWLIDARLVPDADDAETQRWEPLLALLAAIHTRRHDAALFWTGATAAYDALRRRVRRHAGPVPVLHVLRPDGAPPLRVLLRARWRLRARDELPTVITPDAALADAAAERGFPTHLVADAAQPPQLLRAHASVTALAEHLRRRTAPR
ncbi:MAG: hypothetical protein KGY99_06175 [Phycisphaerae bacterium]|nr:hypothetical protein [Phycisphaerae bacterium]